ncbi:MAG TPA: hypothetical protein VGN13_05430 [Solirubrobacteraceae bacterium]|jgi:hypothetical protein
MPALGNSNRERFVAPPQQQKAPTPAPAYHAPLVYAPPKPAGPPLRSSPFHEATPFHQALQQAHERVQQAHARVIHQWTPEARRQEAEDQRVAPPINALERATREGGVQSLRAEAARAQVQVARERQRSAAGASPLNLGFVDLTPLATTLANLKVPGLGGVPGKLVNEAIDLPSQTFLSSAIAGSAASQAFEKQTGLGAGAGSYAPAEGLLAALGHQVTHPVQSFEQAPLSTALLFAGGENALGRLVGRAGRAGLAGDRVAEALSTARPDLQLAAGESIPLRSYSTDPLRKAAQLGYEKALTKLPGGLRQADPFQAEGWRLNRNLVGGTFKVGQVDKVAAAQEATRRTLVKGTAQQMAELHPGQATEHLVPLIVQRAVRSPETAVEDLQTLRGQWVAAQDGLKGARLRANKVNVAHVDHLLANPQLEASLPAAFDAAARVEAIQKPLTAAQVHGGQLRPGQVKSALFPYAQLHMGATHDGTGLVGPDGQALTTPRILQHLEDSGLTAPGYLSHKVGVRGKSSFFQSTSRQPGLERFGRTGASFANGTADHSWEAMLGTMASQASKAAQLEVRAGTLNRLGVRPEGNGAVPLFANEGAAQLAADNFHMSAEGQKVSGRLGEVVPVHVGSGRIVAAGNVHPTATVQDELRQFGLAEHTPVGAEDYGKYVLMHKGVVDRLTAHDRALNAGGDGGLFLQAYQKGFRKAKLNTSIPHIAGVVQEQAIRLAAEGVAPGAHLPARVTIGGRTVKVPAFGGRDVGGFAGRAGAKLDRNLKELAQIVPHSGQMAADWGPEGAKFRELESSLANRGGLAGAQKATDAVRKADQVHSEALAHVWGAAEAAARSRVASPVVKFAHVWAAAVEGGLAHVEHSTRNALLAKGMKDSGLIDSYRSVNKAMDQAVKQQLAGKLTPQVADALAQKIDDMGGNWNRQTPAVRTLVGKYAPFGLWWLNSMRWLYRMPVTHPIKTAVAAALYQATREQRGKEGQGFDAAHPVPGFLQGTIKATLPFVGRVPIDLPHYSPGGTGGPEAGQTFAEQFLPAGSSIYSALKGQNPLTGNKLTAPDGKPLSITSKLLNTLVEAGTAPLPLATQAQKLLEHGAKGYGTANLATDLAHAVGVGPATTKPHTERSWPQVLTKLLSPVRFDFPSAGTSTGGSGRSSAASLSPGEVRELAEAHQAAGGFTKGELAEIKRLSQETR